ncbi:MAG: hypothetical protein R8K20_02345 [Gallionellaceae bacterium]
MNKFVVALLLSGLMFNALAQTVGNQTPASQAPNNGQSTCSNTAKTTSASLDTLKLGDYVTVHVPHQKYVDYFTKNDSNLQPTPVLYIKGFPINGLSWVHSGCESFSFYLVRTEESRDVWGKILSQLTEKKVNVGIGTEQKGFITEIGKTKLVLNTTEWTLWWFAFMTLVTGSIIWMGKKSGLLRDLSKQVLPSTLPVAPLPPDERPFSLGRVQMAFWFVLTVGAYTYIWIKTGDISNIIPDSILALAGISAGTTVISAVVDSTASVQMHEKGSGNFFTDILSDGDGISFHRFQMLVWTIVLGAVFLNKVSANLIMPDFDTQLLGLMGVASGTYLGFKIPASK